MNRVTAVIVAAGEGRRFGGPKQFVPLKGKALLDWSLEAFSTSPFVEEIVLVLPDPAKGARYAEKYPKISAVARGGERRQDSVRSGLAAVRGGDDDIVLVHDGARPLVTQEVIERVLEATRTSGAAVPVVPIEDTVKEVASGRIARSPDRTGLFRAQTPQGFKLGLLKRALDEAERTGAEATDEAAFVERLGQPVAAVDGDVRNIKITTPLDLVTAEAFIGR